MKNGKSVDADLRLSDADGMAYTQKTGRVDAWDPESFSRARVSAGITYDEMAARLGVSRTQVFTWTQARRPPRPLLPKIAKTLGVSQRSLLK